MPSKSSKKPPEFSPSAPPHPLPPPPVVPHSDWESVDLPFNIGSGRSIYAGLERDHRLRLKVYRRKGDGHLIGKVWFGVGADGPPGHVHGGAVAYVLDEAMGSVAWMNDHPALAAKLEFQFLRMTPLEVDLDIEAWIQPSEPSAVPSTSATRRLEIIAQLRLPSGEVSVAGRGEFAILSKRKVAAMGAEAFDPQGLLKKPTLKWAPDDAS